MHRLNALMVGTGLALVIGGVALLVTGLFWHGVIFSIIGIVTGFAGAIIFRPS